MEKSTVNMVLSVIAIIISLFSLNISYSELTYQRESEPTIDPNIEISLDEGEYNKFFSANSIARIQGYSNGDFGFNKEDINFKVYNKGKGEVKFINFYLKDLDKKYVSSSVNIQGLESLEQ